MSGPVPTSVAAAARSGARAPAGSRNPYAGELADTAEARAWQAAYDGSVRAGTVRLLHDRVAMFEDVIARAKADMAETLAEIDRLERPVAR